MFAMYKTSWILWNFDKNEFQLTWTNSDTLRICYSVNGALVTLLTSGIYEHLKRAATHLFNRQSENHAFFKIIEFLLWFKTPWGRPLDRPPGKTEERKPDPMGNYNVRIPGGRPEEWSGLKLTST